MQLVRASAVFIVSTLLLIGCGGEERDWIATVTIDGVATEVEVSQCDYAGGHYTLVGRDQSGEVAIRAVTTEETPINKVHLLVKEEEQSWQAVEVGVTNLGTTYSGDAVAISAIDGQSNAAISFTFTCQG